MLLILASLFVGVIVIIWFHWGEYFLLGCKIPGPPATPVIGNLLSIKSGDPETLFNALYGLHLQYGRLVRFWAGPKLAVFMTDPADIQAILGNPKLINRDFYLSLPFYKILGNGLIVNRDEEWKSHRKLLTPAFHFKVLQGYIPNFGRLSDELVEKLEDLCDGRTFDPLNQMGQVTLDSIKDAVFGVNAQWSERENFMDLFIQAGELMTMCGVRPWLVFDWAFKRTESGKAFFNLRNEINMHSSMMIAHKVDEFRKSEKKAVNVDEMEEGGETRPFIDSLVEESEREGTAMSVDELQEELNTLIIAAVDTSASTLACLLNLMGVYPEIQQTIVDEMDSIFGNDTRRPTSDDINQMVVLDRCIKETLRLFPTAPWINREISEDTTLPSGYVLPSWSLVMVFAYAVHRDPENFVDPDKFWPDRWLPEHSQDRHPYAFVPFGAGKRSCIGQKYAYLQMKTVISTVLRRFTVTSSRTFEDLDRLVAGPTIRPLEGYQIELQKRNK